MLDFLDRLCCFDGLLSTIARFARLANWSVENVSALALIEGDMHTMNFILPCPIRLSLRIRVSLLLRKGIWVLLLSINADLQWPRQQRLPLMLLSSWMRIYRYWGDKSEGILNFSEPAKSTTLRELDWKVSVSLEVLSYSIWNIECDLDDFELAWVDPVALFFRPIER